MFSTFVKYTNIWFFCILTFFIPQSISAQLIPLDDAIKNSTYSWDESAQEISLKLSDQSSLVFVRDIKQAYSPSHKKSYNLVQPLSWSKGRLWIDLVDLTKTLKSHSLATGKSYKVSEIEISNKLEDIQREVHKDKTTYTMKFSQKTDYQFAQTGNIFTLTLSQPVEIIGDFNSTYKTGQIRNIKLLKKGLKTSLSWEVNHLVGLSDNIPTNDSTNIVVHFYRPGKSPQELGNSLQSTKRKIKTIIVDAGHGGKDAGAVGKKTNEKSITLKVAKELKKTLTKAGYKAKLTRSNDKFLTLNQRSTLANKWQGDLFLSLHCNAIGGTASKKKKIKGFKIFILREASDDDDKELAKRENKYIKENITTSKSISFVEWIKLEHQLNLYTKQSEEFASYIVRQFEFDQSKIRKHGSGAGQAGFYVLVGTFMPAVLVEMGFISNTADEKYMNSSKGQKAIANRITQAIVAYDKSLQ